MLATEVTPTSWTFTTIHSPDDGGHTVSGHRQFGIKNNGNGTFTFYTRAADRLTTDLDEFAGEGAFAGAEALWNSLLTNLVEYMQMEEALK